MPPEPSTATQPTPPAASSSTMAPSIPEQARKLLPLLGRDEIQAPEAFSESLARDQ